MPCFILFCVSSNNRWRPGEAGRFRPGAQYGRVFAGGGAWRGEYVIRLWLYVLVLYRISRGVSSYFHHVFVILANTAHAWNHSKSKHMYWLRSTINLFRSQAGTPYYTAPEMIRGESYSYPADCWSFGEWIIMCNVLWYCLLKRWTVSETVMMWCFMSVYSLVHSY